MLHTRRKMALLALVIAGALVAGCGAPAAPAATATAVPAAGSPLETYPEVARISLEEAKTAFDEGAAVFVDVRPAGDYDYSHVPGATNIFFRDIDDHLDELDKGTWIITYCDCPHEEESARVAFVLLENGFSKATPMVGGLYAWWKAGFPVDH